MGKYGELLCDYPLIINFEDLPIYIKDHYNSFCDDYVIKTIIPADGKIYVKEFIKFYSRFKPISVTEIMDIFGCLNIKKLVELNNE